mmetsp:Transcript_31381/g.82275  ORF Transcript_31381/g.82275 Transcript_31381/m.82275 type:complete len:542 (+) Transcript_31381:55-1680(+)
MSGRDEEVAALTMSCVRELLSKRGLKKTLAALDEECPRDEAAVSKRSELARMLGIEKYLLKNKEAGSPRVGMLEVMAGYFRDKALRGSRASVTSIIPITPETDTSSPQQLATARRPSQSRSGRKSGVELATSRSAAASSRGAAAASLFAGPSRAGRAAVATPAEAQMEELEFEDIEVEDFETDGGDRSSVRRVGRCSTATAAVPRNIPSSGSGGRAVSAKEIREMKTLIFPPGQPGWNEAWQVQGLQFCDCPVLPYGLVQPEGGPCGVVAPVQATVIKGLLASGTSPADASPAECTVQLATAITEIVWRAGSGAAATLVVPSEHGSGYQAFECQSRSEMSTTVTAKLSGLQAAGGCIALVYSVILSRSVAAIQKQMDEQDRRLMGAHAYCAQELVNLLTLGSAVSNVFDGDRDLGGGIRLCGVTQQADVGLLSLFEHYRSIEVGEYLKTPRYPVWVTHAQSHYSVIYTTNGGLTSTKAARDRFDMFYYDPLGRQTEEVRITVDPRGGAGAIDDELTSPIEHCIRTKWQDAGVDWNGHCGIY